MFSSKLTTTPLTTSLANSVFSKISYDYIMDDSSFGATLRALVYPRMREDDCLCVSYSNYTTSSLRRHRISVSQLIHELMSSIGIIEDRISIINLINAGQDENIAWLEMVRSNLTDSCSGFIHLEKVAEFFKKIFHVACFINPDLKSVLLFTENLDERHMHYLQCAVPAFLPWYFNPEDGLREIEMELISSLREKTSDHYMFVLEKIASEYNLREMNIRNTLNGFEARGLQVELRSVLNEIQNISYDIDRYNQTIYEKLREKREKEMRYMGVQAKISSASESAELMDYFLHNKSLSVVCVNDCEFTFEVCSYIEYFDEDLAQTIINNRESYVYKPDGRSMSGIPAEDMEKLMTAIFVDRSIRMRFGAAYRMKLGTEVVGLRGRDFSSPGYMPNPHIHYHSCLGDYRPIINEMLSNGDYIGCVEQCCASCRSLNFGDGIVMSEFMKDMYSTVCKPCIELPDGSVVTPRDAIKWLKIGDETNE